MAKRARTSNVRKTGTARKTKKAKTVRKRTVARAQPPARRADDHVDGCDVDFLAAEATLDAALPPARGGVATPGGRRKLAARPRRRGAFSLTWLPQVLLDAGLKVAEQPGWETRGHGDVRNVRGVICHHTAGPASGNMPSLRIVTEGRPGLSGPLSQLCLGRDGTFYVVAAGRAHHAGGGDWQGVTSGNTSFIGIEAENTGRADDAWPPAQMDAYRRGVAAILTKIRADASMCCGHKEFALPQGRKIDPLFDMDAFRREVAAIMAGTAPGPLVIALVDPQNRPTLQRGATGELVRRVQGLLGVAVTGTYDGATEAAVRAFQRENRVLPDGIVGPRTWAVLDP